MWNIWMHAAQGMMTHRVSEREQGELQGAIGSLRSLSLLIGRGLFPWTYAWFINPEHSFHLRGAPYYLGAALLFTAMLMSTRIEQPQFAAISTTTAQNADVVPPEGVTSGSLAPFIDPPE